MADLPVGAPLSISIPIPISNVSRSVCAGGTGR